MKKLLSLLFVLLAVSLAVSTAFADGITYEVQEYDFTVDIPVGWSVFTRNMEADDPLLAEYGMDAETINQELELRSTYIDAIILEPLLAELTVSVGEGRSYKLTHNYNLMTDEDLNEYIDIVLSEKGKDIVNKTVEENQEVFSDVSGLTYTKAEIYKNESFTFIVLNGVFEMDDQKVYIQQYQTVVNGVLVGINYKKYGSQLSDEDEDILKAVSDSLEFGQIIEQKRSLLSRLSTYSNYGSIGFALVIAGALIFIVSKIINRNKAK